jgi:Tfp pilus assembly protein PilO
MLSRKFTAREAVVILVLVAAILGYFYYYVVYQYFEDQMAKYDVTQVQDEIDYEQLKVARLQKMKEDLENEGPSESILGVYNNQSEELNALAAILEGNATDISMNWGDPELNGKIVRRDVTISFNTGSFAEAGDIIKQIADCEYTLLIVDLSMDESEIEEDIEVPVASTAAAGEVDVEAEGEEGVDADTASEPQTETVTLTKKVTSVSITIRFFETTDGAVNLNGLTQPASETTVEEDDDGLPSTAELNEQINGN